MKANVIMLAAANVFMGTFGVDAIVPVFESCEVASALPKNAGMRLNCEAVLPSEPEEKRRYPRILRRQKNGRQMAVPSKSSLKNRNLQKDGRQMAIPSKSELKKRNLKR